jgi:hypothetical protein
MDWLWTTGPKIHLFEWKKATQILALDAGLFSPELPRGKKCAFGTQVPTAVPYDSIMGLQSPQWLVTSTEAEEGPKAGAQGPPRALLPTFCQQPCIRVFRPTGAFAIRAN